MGSFSIYSNGEEVYTKSTGFENVESNVHASSETQYRIGSISKSFTASLIMQQIEQGKLELSTLLSEYYPQIPNADNITIEDMLRHRSGIFNFTSADDFPMWMYTDATKEDLIERISSYSSAFEPRSESEYSNSNYVLLTFILEDVTGREYAELLQSNICIPCGLTHTYLGLAHDTANHEAFSYLPAGHWMRYPPANMSIPLGAGAIVSTPSDINQFYNCLFGGEIVSSSSLASMKKDANGYGIGMFPNTRFGRLGFGHTGGIDAFQSQVILFPEENVSIAYTLNANSYEELMNGLTKIYFEEEFDLPLFAAETEVSNDILLSYVGTYSSNAFPLKITISVANGKLQAQASGQPSFELKAESNTRYSFLPAGLVMEFSDDTNFTLEQGGASFNFTKE